MLPVSSSVIAASALDAFLYAAYDLPEARCRLLRAGINHTYLVEAGSNRFVLRIYTHNWRSASEIREELRLLNHLQSEGLPVSYPLANRDGELLQQLEAPEGSRYAVLFSYAPGEKIIENADAVHRAAGALMAKMHLAAAELNLQRAAYTYQLMISKALHALDVFVPATSSERLQLAELLDRIRPQLEHALAALPGGVLHLDVWFDNLNIDSDGKITLFDFDFCGNGSLALDPAYYLMQLHFINPEGFEQQAGAFLDGYETVRPLTEEERTALPVLGIALYCFYLGVQCERFENYSSVFVSATYLKRYIAARILRYAAFQKL